LADRATAVLKSVPIVRWAGGHDHHVEMTLARRLSDPRSVECEVSITRTTGSKRDRSLTVDKFPSEVLGRPGPVPTVARCRGETELGVHGELANHLTSKAPRPSTHVFGCK